jgi:hypothetical protein
MQTAAPPMLKPTLIAGVITGVVASIPTLGGIAMLACCAPVIGCGFLAAYLYSKECRGTGAPFRAGRGALVGWVSGVWFAITASVVGSVLGMLTSSGDPFGDAMEKMESSPGMTPEGMEMAEEVIGFLQDTPMIVLFLIGLVFYLVLTSIFATIGGAIGGAVFKVEEEVPAIQP